MSATSVRLAIVAAVVKTEEELGGNITWNTVNERQQSFISDALPKLREVAVTLPEISSSASVSVDGDVKTIKVTSILDVLVSWAREGTRTKIIRKEHGTEKEYDGVRIDKDHVSYLSHEGHPHPIAEVETKSGDIVCMTMYDGTPTSEDLPRVLEQIQRGHPRALYGFGGLRFPMVDLKEQPDISWLVGMNTADSEGYPADITEATQETKLKMNEKGARVRSEVRVSTRVIMAAAAPQSRPDHIIDQPFLVWFVRNGVREPIAIVHVTTEDWKDPKNLKM